MLMVQTSLRHACYSCKETHITLSLISRLSDLPPLLLVLLLHLRSITDLHGLAANFCFLVTLQLDTQCMFLTSYDSRDMISAT
jgi:hypothetical protein